MLHSNAMSSLPLLAARCEAHIKCVSVACSDEHPFATAAESKRHPVPLCAESDDKDSVLNELKARTCTSKIVFEVIADAFAGAWVAGECGDDDPIECRTCCKDPQVQCLQRCALELERRPIRAA